MIKGISIRLNLDAYRGELERELDNSLGVLRAVLRSIDDDSYQSKAAQPAAGTVIQLSLSQGKPDPQALRKGEILKTYNSLVRALISFIDKMIALSEARLDTAQIRVDRTLKTEAEIVEYASAKANGLLQNAIAAVAVDTSLTNPKKLAKFSLLPAFVRDACLSYFALRRCIEHHGGIAQQNIRLLFRRLAVLVGGTELVQLPHEVEQGTEVGIQFMDQHKDFAKGESVELTEQELEQIILTIKVVIAPEIARVVAAKLNTIIVAERSGE